MKRWSYIILVIIFSISHKYLVFGQEEINLTAGLGVPELLYIGGRYQSNQHQIGLNIGSLSYENTKEFSLATDYYYHFGGFSKLSNRRPWYGRLGLSYYRTESKSAIHKYLLFNTRIGRDFNISENVGIEIGIGASISVFHREIRKKPGGGNIFNLGENSDVYPNLGIGIFHRI